MPTGNSAQLEHAPVTYAKNKNDISSRRSSKTVLCVVHGKMSFLQNERGFIVRVYYETCSYKSAREQFTKKFVGCEPLTKSSICRLMRKFESTGNVGNAGYQHARSSKKSPKPCWNGSFPTWYAVSSVVSWMKGVGSFFWCKRNSNIFFQHFSHAYFTDRVALFVDHPV